MDKLQDKIKEKRQIKEYIMEVVLYEDVPNLGEAGAIVNVKDGYARNYLLPKKLAVVADQKNIKMMEHQTKVVAAKQTKFRTKAEELAKKLSEVSITIEHEAGEEDKLFGSVTTMEISNALRKEGYTIDKRHIRLESPIKKIGVYDIPVRLHAEVDGVVKVWVVKK